ncbi:MAG: hypothetical protein QNJ70_11085 [Xenococcaceae cyanobacterium MO_207.B15]|nr:hypothetical protein [Xenococcaceae cyanobacterium MO_207.B15]
MSWLKTQLPLLALTISWEICTQTALALPPPEDIPEEVLRTEIIWEGRSPITGKSLNATEYAEIQARLKESRFSPQVSSEIQELIFLLQLRKLFKTLIPFY